VNNSLAGGPRMQDKGGPLSVYHFLCTIFDGLDNSEIDEHKGEGINRGKCER